MKVISNTKIDAKPKPSCGFDHDAIQIKQPCNHVPLQPERGKPGPKGDAATIEIAGVVTVEPNEPANVKNIGDESNAKFVFYLPKGDPGNKGEPGDGSGNVITVNGIAPDENGNVELPEGSEGPPGKDGISVTHQWNGTILVVTSASGTSSANLQGPAGERGETGPEGPQGLPGNTGDMGPAGPEGPPGKDGISVTHRWENGTNLVVTSASGTSSANLRGPQGQQGNPGQDGTSVTHYWYGTTLVVESASGSSSADLKGERGATGEQGSPGKDGISASHQWNGTTLVITSASGTSSANLQGPAGLDGKTPVKGIDYYTDSDKDEIVNLVMSSLSTWNGGSY